MTKAILLARLTITPLLERVTSHTAAPGPRHQNKEHPRPHRVAGQVLLGQLMLTLTTPTVDHRDPMGIGPGPYSTGEPAGHPHQMRVVQLLITTPMPPPPPHPKPTRVMPQREVGVEHNTIHTVITARQKIHITFGELINPSCQRRLSL